MVRAKYPLGAFGLSPNFASGELHSLLLACVIQLFNASVSPFYKMIGNNSYKKYQS